MVRTAGDSCAGRIVELITRQPTTFKEAAYSVLAGTKPFLTNQLPGAIADYTGTLLVYSPRYQYEAGLSYASGALQPLRMAPGPAGPDTCYDYYLVGYDNTGVQVIHDFLYSSCTGGIPGAGGGWGGGGGNTTGGGGGGGGGMLTPTRVLVVAPDKPVNNIQQFLKCFTANQSATLTVYARQPVPGSNATWSLNGGVGHTFISISQNGITRVFGFYPTSGVSIIRNAMGMFGDNSQTPYTVSITTTITGTNLNNLLQYTYANSSSTYDLNNYNCTDFGIGAAAAAGLHLPDTYGVWGAGYGGGSNPGNLGQDMSTMSLPPGAQRGPAGTSPSNNGGC